MYLGEEDGFGVVGVAAVEFEDAEGFEELVAVFEGLVVERHPVLLFSLGVGVVHDVFVF